MSFRCGWAGKACCPDLCWCSSGWRWPPVRVKSAEDWWRPASGGGNRQVVVPGALWLNYMDFILYLVSLRDAAPTQIAQVDCLSKSERHGSFFGFK